MDNKIAQEQYKKMMGKWYSWDSPIGLGLGLLFFSTSIFMLAEIAKILRSF